MMREGRGQWSGRGTTDNNRSTINNHPLMGVAKAGRDTAVKEKAALAVNRVFCHRVDHGGSRKVGANGRTAVDNR
jgi:hypothetical protein